MSPYYVIHAATKIAKVTPVGYSSRETWTVHYFFRPFSVKTPREAGRGDEKKTPESKSINNVSD